MRKKRASHEGRTEIFSGTTLGRAEARPYNFCFDADDLCFDGGGADAAHAAAREICFEEWTDRAAAGKARRTDDQSVCDCENGFDSRSPGRGRTGVDYRGIVEERDESANGAAVCRGPRFY